MNYKGRLKIIFKSMNKNPIQQLLTLPTEAQNRLEQDSSINQKLSYQCEGQSIIINDLSISIPDSERIAKQISDVDLQISEVNQSLDEALSVLSDLLQQPKTDSSAGGTILSSILLNTIKSINNISYNAIQKSRPYASIFDIMNIEQQIFTIIGDLSDRGILDESEEESQNRTEFIKSHTDKLLNYISSLNLPTDKK